MKTCPKCNTANKDDAAFCIECGAALEQKVEEQTEEKVERIEPSPDQIQPSNVKFKRRPTVKTDNALVLSGIGCGLAIVSYFIFWWLGIIAIVFGVYAIIGSIRKVTKETKDYVGIGVGALSTLLGLGSIVLYVVLIILVNQGLL